MPHVTKLSMYCTFLAKHIYVQSTYIYIYILYRFWSIEAGVYNSQSACC